MPERCPHCGREFANSRALGSHLHYLHETDNWTKTGDERSEVEKKRFEKLFDNCLSNRGLPRPREIDKVEQAVKEIPEGISSTIDQYREAYRCAVNKEKLVKEIEEEIAKEMGADGTK